MVVASGSGEGGHSAPSFSAQLQRPAPATIAAIASLFHHAAPLSPASEKSIVGLRWSQRHAEIDFDVEKEGGCRISSLLLAASPNRPRPKSGPGPAGPRRPSSSGRAPSHLTFDSPDRPPFFEHLAHRWSQLRAHTNLDPAIPRARVPLLRLLVPSLLAVSVFNATLLTHTRHTSGTCDGSSLLSHTPHPLSSTPHPPSTGLTPRTHSSCQHTFPSPSPPPW